MKHVIGTVKTTFILLILSVFFLVGCRTNHKSSKFVSICRDEVNIMDINSLGGTDYVILGDDQYIYVSALDLFLENTESLDVQILTTRNYDDKDVVFWDQANETIVFCENYSLYSYNPVSQNIDLVWTMKGGTSKDRVSIAASGDQWLILHISHWTKLSEYGYDQDRQYYFTHRYYSLKVSDLSIQPLMEYSEGFVNLPDFLCIEDGTAYFIQKCSENEMEIISVNLNTCDTEKLGRFSGEYYGDSEGEVVDSILYFRNGSTGPGLFAVDLRSGSIEFYLLTGSQGLRSIRRLTEIDNNIYILMVGGTDKGIQREYQSGLFTYNIDAHTISLLNDSCIFDGDLNMYMSSEKIILYSLREVYTIR